jgi:hypothetical protein
MHFMKRSVPFTFFISIILGCTQQISAQQTSSPDKASPDWYQQALENIRALETAFYPQATQGQYMVANSTNRLGFHITPHGYTVQPVSNQAAPTPWKVHFRLLGIGRTEAQWKTGHHYLTEINDRSLTYQYGHVNVEYINEEGGLRQNFIINKKDQGTDRLKVFIELESSLEATLVHSNKLVLHTPGHRNQVQMMYEDLKVWDAQHQPLAAAMQLQDNVLMLVVDDRNAQYPITIDPVNKTPEWSSSANGLLSGLLSQVQVNSSLYGYAVTGLGDVNGDGYGDAAISAPAMIDIFSGSGSLASVGAVFVFFGSASGLSATPAKTLQPNTAVAGALFGLSVDAGDVTGDGINDIIVGAPLDAYQTTAAALLGSPTVTVKAGKVYVYRSETLSGSNPSGFLEIKLQGSNFFSTGIVGLLLSNIHITPLFGYSVAVTDDLNGDNKKDIIIGCPSYLGTSLLAVQSGSAFVYYSTNLTTTAPVQLQTPSSSLLGLASLPIINSSALLYGYSVDGVGDYNNDGRPDVVVGAPAGIDLSSLGGALTGQVLGGSAYVYYGNASGINSAIGARLQASASGLLSNAANLFGFKVKGVRNSNGAHNGNIVIGAPLGGLITNALSLTIQSGSVHVFKKKSSTPAGVVLSDQRLESPRSTSVLQVLNTLHQNILLGAAIDNAYDVNCDGYEDLVVGEPLSSGATLTQLQANAVGGAAYLFLGDGSGGYNTTPHYTAAASHGTDLLSINAVSLFGYSVAGAPVIKGAGTTPRILAGAPAGALDFDNSLLNLGSTLGTLFNFTLGDNGPGKAYLFHLKSCPLEMTLPVTLVEFKGQKKEEAIDLAWKTTAEKNVNHYEVEKSADGVHFNMIGLVFSWDNSLSNQYLFSDHKPVKGNNFYRLKMADKDGSHTYSQTISFRIAEQASGDVRIAPNPARNSIRILLTGIAKGLYRVELHNLTGQLQQARAVTITQYQQVEVLERTGSMSPGIYWMSIYDKNNHKISTNRVILN